MKPFLIYNWKTYITSADDAVALAGSLEGSDTVEVVLCPSALHIPVVAEVIRGSGTALSLGAQDISIAPDAPQTGALSGEQLAAAGVSYSIVGHAETRAAGTTDAMVADKAHHALASGLTPVVCLSGRHNDDDGDADVLRQLESVLQRCGDVLQGGTGRIVVVYEPTAHIGAKDALAPEKIKQVVTVLRSVLQQHAVQGAPVMYGGSVHTANVKRIIEVGGADGFLLGRSGVDADAANAILHSF